jgi:splicing factor 3B subunit 3
MITSLTKTSMVTGGREIIVYTTLMGAIGAFVPFVSREDVDLFQTLELHMRSEKPSLAGRDHLYHRSSYVPVKASHMTSYVVLIV